MENKWLHKIQTFLRRLNIKNDRKLVIYLVCVGIASVFWLLNALEKQYEVELSFPVRYTNHPKNKLLVNDPPSHFTLDVKSYGFTLLRYKLSMAFSPLVFNINEFGGESMEDSSRSNYALSSRLFRNEIADQLSNELTITGVHPDTIYFQFDRIISQKKKVEPAISFQLKKQHYQYESVQVKPDSVIVQGPESILDTLKTIKTVAQHYKELAQSVQRNVPLQEIKHLEFSPKRVVVQIPIEEFTEKELTIPVQIQGIPDSLHISLFPSEVKLNFLVGLSRFSSIKSNDFEAIVSYEDILTQQDYLPIKLERVPPHLKAVNLAPRRIEYLIEK